MLRYIIFKYFTPNTFKFIDYGVKYKPPIIPGSHGDEYTLTQ